jgi:hypothetical protein
LSTAKFEIPTLVYIDPEYSISAPMNNPPSLIDARSEIKDNVKSSVSFILIELLIASGKKEVV